MPSPGRRTNAPSAQNSSSYRRRSPDRRRKPVPSPRTGNGRGSPSRQRERRRSVGQSHETVTRSRGGRSTRPGDRRSGSPLGNDSNGHSFPSAGPSKRKISPKRERDLARVSAPPRKMMRSTSPEDQPAREIPLIGPEVISSVPGRGYVRTTSITTRYSGGSDANPPKRSYSVSVNPTAPTSRNYTGNSSPPPSRGYSVSSSTQQPIRGYVETPIDRDYSPPTKATSRSFANTSTSFRGSASEERVFRAGTSAHKRTTGHMTSHRFSDMRDSEDAINREKIDLNSAKLSNYVFNVANAPPSRLLRDSHGIVREIMNPGCQKVVRREIINPESLKVVRRAASPSHQEYRINADEDDDDGPHNSRPAWRERQNAHIGEGATPIFNREEIIQQSIGSRPIRDEDLREQQQVTRYMSPVRYQEAPRNRDSRNGQPSHSRDLPSHSRDIPSHSSRDLPSHTRSRDYYDDQEPRNFHSRQYERDEPANFERNDSSRSTRRGDDRDDLRREIEIRRDTLRHSRERSRPNEQVRDHRADSDSDLRVRINEKRSTRSRERTFSRDRRDDRGREHHTRERRHSPPRRRPSHSGERSRARGEPVSRAGPSRRELPPPERYDEDRNEFQEAPKPWEIDPEFVPRGQAYFEHDNREDIRMMRGNMMHRGGGMRRPYRGGPASFPRGGGYRIRGPIPHRGFPPPRVRRRSSPQWKHDMFDKVDDTVPSHFDK